MSATLCPSSLNSPPFLLATAFLYLRFARLYSLLTCRLPGASAALHFAALYSRLYCARSTSLVFSISSLPDGLCPPVSSFLVMDVDDCRFDMGRLPPTNDKDKGGEESGSGGNLTCGDVDCLFNLGSGGTTRTPLMILKFRTTAVFSVTLLLVITVVAAAQLRTMVPIESSHLECCHRLYVAASLVVTLRLFSARNNVELAHRTGLVDMMARPSKNNRSSPRRNLSRTSSL